MGWPRAPHEPPATPYDLVHPLLLHGIHAPTGRLVCAIWDGLKHLTNPLHSAYDLFHSLLLHGIHALTGRLVCAIWDGLKHLTNPLHSAYDLFHSLSHAVHAPAGYKAQLVSATLYPKHIPKPLQMLQVERLEGSSSGSSAGQLGIEL